MIVIESDSANMVPPNREKNWPIFVAGVWKHVFFHMNGCLLTESPVRKVTHAVKTLPDQKTPF